jgi:hypothetical protein
VCCAVQARKRGEGRSKRRKVDLRERGKVDLRGKVGLREKWPRKRAQEERGKVAAKGGTIGQEEVS